MANRPHFYLKWAIQLGYSKDDAEVIAHSDNSVDSIWKGKSFMPIIGDQSYHFNTNNALSGSSGDSRIINSQKHFNKANTLISKAIRIKSSINKNAGFLGKIGNFFKKIRVKMLKKKALKNIGQGLHPLQDVDAHKDRFVRDNGLYKDHLKHMEADDKTDSSANGPKRFNTTKTKTKNILQKFLKLLRNI